MTDFCKTCGGYDDRHQMWCKENVVPTTRRIDASNPATPANPLDVQVGGSHYKNRKIQPAEFSHANKLNGLESSIVKRITRWRDKPAETRFQDLEKIKHEVDLLIELEKKYG
jgi:hypothetical protein